MARNNQRLSEGTKSSAKSTMKNRLTNPNTLVAKPTKTTTSSSSKGKIPAKATKTTHSGSQGKFASANPTASSKGKYSYAKSNKSVVAPNAKRQAEIERKASLGISLVRPDEQGMKAYNKARATQPTKQVKVNTSRNKIK